VNNVGCRYGYWLAAAVAKSLSHAKCVLSFMPLQYKVTRAMYSEFPLDVFQRSYTFINNILFLHLNYAEG
jgi:hypothetical protein